MQGVYGEDLAQTGTSLRKRSSTATANRNTTKAWYQWIGKHQYLLYFGNRIDMKPIRVLPNQKRY